MKAKNLSIIALFAVLTFIGGLISIPIGPVPISLQTLMVGLTGLIFEPRNALVTMVVHLLLKVFIQGFQIILAPSFGFVLGFILAAFLSALYISNRPRSKGNIIIAIFIAAICPYIIGLPYMAFILNYVNGGNFDFLDLIKFGFLIFIPGDTIKAILTYFLYKKLYPILKRNNYV